MAWVNVFEGFKAGWMAWVNVFEGFKADGWLG
jgi:hypothetical protein